MKKTLLIALLGLLAISCSNDDPTSLQEGIVGTWEKEIIQNFPYPADMPTYIRFDGTSFYSSDTETTPSSNAKSYTISVSSETGRGILAISGCDKEYTILLVNDILDLSYVVTPADPDNNIEEVRQSLPYKKSKAQTATP